MQIENAMRHHFTPTGKAIIKRVDNRTVGKDREKLKASCVDGRTVKMAQQLWETTWTFFKKLNIELSYDQQFHSWVYTK